MPMLTSYTLVSLFMRRPLLLSALPSSFTTSRLTILLPPTTEVLIEIKSSSTIPQLHIAQPLRHNIQHPSIQSNGRPHQRNHNPRLPRIITIPDLLFPPSQSPLLSSKGCRSPRISSLPLCPPSKLFPRSILDPIDGGEVLVTSYFFDFLGDLVFCM